MARRHRHFGPTRMPRTNPCMGRTAKPGRSAASNEDKLKATIDAQGKEIDRQAGRIEKLEAGVCPQCIEERDVRIAELQAVVEKLRDGIRQILDDHASFHRVRVPGGSVMFCKGLLEATREAAAAEKE